MSKTACVTGITGQTGSYLAELLLDKGYKVYGLKRSSSNFNTQRIDHLYGHPNLKLVYGDMADYSSLVSFVSDSKPDLFFNCAALSHVRVSFEIPEYAMDITGTGVLRCLEAIRKYSPETRFLQCSTSELFGSTPPPQDENTRFHPRSPYACAKLAGYWAVVNYREAYDMFAVNAISFNHETVADFMPVIFKEDNIIDIKPISEVVIDHAGINFDKNLNAYQEGEVGKDLYLWDAKGWTKVKFASGYPHDGNKKPRMINARNACFMTTDTHVVIMDAGVEKEAQNIEIGDKVNIINYPCHDIVAHKITATEAELIGFIVGDGCITNGQLRLTAKNKDSLQKYEKMWAEMGGSYLYKESSSGFTGGLMWQLHLRGHKAWVKDLDLYDSFEKKRIPKIILNSSIDIQKHFLIGYNNADGLKANPCAYEFKNFKTNSATLAAGLIYLVSNVTKQIFNLTVEESYKHGFRALYYSINLLSDNPRCNARSSVDKYDIVKPLLQSDSSMRGIHRKTGISYGFISKVNNGYVPTGKSHLEKPKNEVKKIIDMHDYDGWFFDLETESGTFHCGIGPGHVHNSPRRAENFVTRKITRAATRIKLGLQDKLMLGNLDAKRDWGHAADTAKALYMIAMAEKPDDYVVATGEMHSVKEFLELVFSKLQLDWEDYVEFDPRFLRPTEVDALCGDSTKLKTELGWKPDHSFSDLVDEMIKYDLSLAEQEKVLKDN